KTDVKFQVQMRYQPGSSFSLDVDMAWDSGVVALFGPSGCGKSTLLELIAGLRPVAQGRVVLDGQVLFDTTAGINRPAPLRGVGWVPQDASLFPHMTVSDNIEYGLPRGQSEGLRMRDAAI